MDNWLAYLSSAAGLLFVAVAGAAVSNAYNGFRSRRVLERIERRLARFENRKH